MKAVVPLLFPLSVFVAVCTADAQWVSLGGPRGAYAFAINGQSLYAGSFGEGVSVTTDEGATWTAMDSGLTSTDVFSLLSSGSFLYAGTFDGGLFISPNGGQTWAPDTARRTNPADTTNPPTYTTVLTNVISLAAYGTDIVGGTYANGVFVSYDSGQTWNPTRLNGLSVYAIVPFGAGMCTATFGGGVYLSALGDTSWVPIDSNLSNINVLSLASVGNTLFAGTSLGGMFYSTNAGTTWTADDSGLTASTINALLAVESNVFAGTEGGVFRSTDMGISWSRVDSLPRVTEVYSLIATGTNLFAGTSGHGIWRRALSQIVITGIASANSGIPGEFKLEQNFPNPFNPSTVIRYSIPRRSSVTLAVFNLLGQQVALLVNSQQDPGFHEIRFDASALATGVYFYRLTAGSYANAKKLLAEVGQFD